MKQILDDSELQNVLHAIEEQWRRNPAEARHVPTAHYLAELIRRELIECGGVEEEQIANANNIAHWFLPYGSAPGSWQYVFADCLLCLMLYFTGPIGEQTSSADKGYALSIWQDFERRLTALLTADVGRLDAQHRRAAEQSLARLAPAAKKMERVWDGGDKGRIGGATHSDPERDAAIVQAVAQAYEGHPKPLAKVIYPEVGEAFGGIGYEAVKTAIRRHKKSMAK